MNLPLDLFHLYWLDVRTGKGHPTKQWPEPMTWGRAKLLSESHKRDLRGHELRYEPLEMHKKYTAGKEPR